MPNKTCGIFENFTNIFLCKYKTFWQIKVKQIRNKRNLLFWYIWFSYRYILF